jgi:glycosyltransferase involved in cell wall biosynthesis
MVQSAIELTVLMPCLNEAETLAACIGKAQAFFFRSGVKGEVLIADNGSDDGSQALATSLGARVVLVTERGYGAALIAGIAAARGRFVIMGDADDSYDFLNLEPFLERLRAGDDLVMGNRFRGGILPGAMPWHHKLIGNPVLSWLGRLFFSARVGDFHCGLRGFRRDAILGLNLRTTGMEFASEMVVKATLGELTISEVPTVLSPDGRSRRPHLKSFRDGWRHLRFLLLFSPRWLFLYPGLALVGIGMLLGAALLGGPLPLGPSLRIGIHTFLVAAMCMIVGVQAISFAVIGRRFASRYGFIPKSDTFDALLEALTLERVLIAALGTIGVGCGILVWDFAEWAHRGFGEMSAEATVRAMIVALTALVVGMQLVMSAFMASMINIPLLERRVVLVEAAPGTERGRTGNVVAAPSRKRA